MAGVSLNPALVFELRSEGSNTQRVTMRYGGEVAHRDSRSALKHPRGAADPSVRRRIPAAI